MASTVKCFKSVLGYKGNKCKGHKWILAIPKLRGLVKIKEQGKRGKKGQCEIVCEARPVGLKCRLLARQKAIRQRPNVGTLLSLQHSPRSGFLLDRVFPIEGISLHRPIRGTGTGSKLNLLLLILSLFTIGTFPIHMCSINMLQPLCRPL